MALDPPHTISLAIIGPWPTCCLRAFLPPFAEGNTQSRIVKVYRVRLKQQRVFCNWLSNHATSVPSAVYPLLAGADLVKWKMANCEVEKATLLAPHKLPCVGPYEPLYIWLYLPAYWLLGPTVRLVNTGTFSYDRFI